MHRHFYLNLTVLGLLLLSVIERSALCGTPDSDPNCLFALGDYADIEVAVPKRGFVGGPPDPSAMIITESIPVWDADFDKRYVRISVIETIRLKDGVRVVMLLDEIDYDGGLMMYRKTRTKPGRHEPLFYSYLDIKLSGCRMVANNARFGKMKCGGGVEDIELRGSSKEYSFGMECPLILTCPPGVSQDMTMRKHGWMKYGDAGVFTESTEVDGPAAGRRTEGVLLRELDQHPRWEPPKKHVRYYDPESKTVGLEEGSGQKMELVLSETHYWGQDNDWLWDRMDRYDSDGYLTMRCRVVRRKQD